jgi:hypothetical protein
VVVTNDAGKTFKRLQSAEWTGFAHVIRQDPKNADLLFLGTEMGLFISLDGGTNWMRSKYQNLPWYALVRDMRISNSGDLAIGTHGRGIYVLDNLASLRALAKSDLSQDVIFYSVKPFVYDVSPQTPSGYGNLEGWTTGSKANLPAFEYYLKERSSQAVKIIIYDSKGNKIKDLNGGTAKGLNKVYWTLDQNPCKVATGGFTAGSPVLFASVIGPRAPIGTYKAVINIGEKKYEQSFQLLENPAKGFTKAKLDLLFTQTMRLFKVQEELYYLVDSLNKRMTALKKIESRTALQEKQYQQLDSLRKEIIETNRKTVFFDEFKYRRRLSDVYIALCTSLEPFSASKTGSIEILEQEFAQIKKEFEKLL